MCDSESCEKKPNDILLSLQGLTKSKTTYGLVAVMPTVLMALKGAGIVLTPQVTAAVYILGGFIYRWITKGSLKDK